MARPVREIADAITRQDVKWLSTLPGIGPTTSEQIVTTLKRKVAGFLAGPIGDSPETPRTKKKPGEAEATPAGPDGKLIDDVYQALMSVGHSPVEARTKLDSVLSAGKSFRTVEEALMIAYSRG